MDRPDFTGKIVGHHRRRPRARRRLRRRSHRSRRRSHHDRPQHRASHDHGRGHWPAHRQAPADASSSISPIRARSRAPPRRCAMRWRISTSSSTMARNGCRARMDEHDAYAIVSTISSGVTGTLLFTRGLIKPLEASGARRHSQHHLDLGPPQCALAGRIDRLPCRQARPDRHDRRTASRNCAAARSGSAHSIRPISSTYRRSTPRPGTRPRAPNFACHQSRHRRGRNFCPFASAPRDLVVDRHRSRSRRNLAGLITLPPSSRVGHMKLKDRIAIVTGAAKRHRPRLRRAPHRRRRRVVLTDIDDATGSATARNCGRKAHYLHCDVGDSTQVDKMVGR